MTEKRMKRLGTSGRRFTLVVIVTLASATVTGWLIAGLVGVTCLGVVGLASLAIIERRLERRIRACPQDSKVT